MGIDNVAIKTFNSTGSQSVCRANEADETKLIESQFITKCTTKYINGSGISFIPGSLSMLPIAGATANETFTLPSDVDAISELIFHCEINLAFPVANETVRVSSSLVLDMINKIEMKIGNLVFQTIRPCDIYARNITEHGAALKLLMSQSDAVVTNGTASNPILTITEGGSNVTDNVTLDFSMSIPFTGRDSNTERSFLQAGASTNSLSMKVYYNQFPSVNGLGGTARAGFLLPASSSNVTGVSTGICVLSHQITQTEKNFIQKNIINRVVNTSQSVEHYFSVNDLTTGSSTLTIDLGSININVSHIILSLATTLYGKTQADVLVTNNGTQGTSWTPREPFRPVRMASTDLGVQSGWLKSAEMVLGNDRTGNVPASCLTTNRIQQFNLKSADNKNLFIIKLADCAFSTAGIPFARLNNKKLVLKFADGFINATNLAHAPATCVHVTCCGTQIQTTVGGAISFSA